MSLLGTQYMCVQVPDAEVRQMALEALEGSLEYGWDAEFGASPVPARAKYR